MRNQLSRVSLCRNIDILPVIPRQEAWILWISNIRFGAQVAWLYHITPIRITNFRQFRRCQTWKVHEVLLVGTFYRSLHLVLSQVRCVCGYSALTIEHEHTRKSTTSFEHSITEALLSQLCWFIKQIASDWGWTCKSITCPGFSWNSPCRHSGAYFYPF